MPSYYLSPLLVGIFVLGSTVFAQDPPLKRKPLNNYKHQQHKKRVQAVKSPIPEEELESGTARNQRSQVFILRVRRNKNRTMRIDTSAAAAPTNGEAIRERYRKNRRKRKALKDKK
jgi:hypothetical protein